MVGISIFNSTGAVLFFANNLFNLFQNLEAERQPAVNAGRILLHHAGTQHILM